MKLRLFLVAWSALWTLGLPLVLTYLWWRGRKDTLYSERVGERLGRYDLSMPGAVWIHAVSLGEVRSAVPLVQALLARGERVVVTCFTPAGRREAERVFVQDIALAQIAVVWVPFEAAWAFRGFFRAFAPKLGLVMEIEVWPRMVMASKAAGVPLFMCNAQYPTPSMERDAKGTLRHAVMQEFAGALVKSDLQASRFASVGLRNIHVTGELRFDQPIPLAQLAAGRAIRAWLGAADRRVVTIASAVEGEDAVYIGAIHALLQADQALGRRPALFVYVPRKPERFEEVQTMLAASGLATARRSVHLDAEMAPAGKPPEVSVFLGDSLGEMYAYLAMADAVIVGGGFTPQGAHNIIEPLALRKSVIVGPAVHTIEYPATEAIAAGVCRRVASSDVLRETLLAGQAADPDPARIEAFFAAHAGATQRTIAALEPYLTSPKTRHPH
jgi:3-deoxy-D-manno-octulosonic-acid transferase